MDQEKKKKTRPYIYVEDKELIGQAKKHSESFADTLHRLLNILKDEYQFFGVSP